MRHSDRDSVVVHSVAKRSDRESLDADLSLPRQKSLTQSVRAQIEGMLLRGEISEGERLSESALATQLNVSRGPVREATRLLAEAGLLTVIHNRGAFVRKIKLEEILHAYDVRAGLAHAAGRLAALRATSTQVDGLRSLWQKMEDAIVAQNPESFYEINRDFHTAIVAITNNPRLIEFNGIIEREVFLFTRRGAIARPRMSNQQHRQIMEAIAVGDEKEAARTFELHIMTGKQRMLDSLS